MIQKLIEAIRKVVSKLLNKENASKALDIDIQTSSKMSEKIRLWSRMYEDKAPWVKDGLQSLNLSTAIAGELARLVTLEMKSEISGSKRADLLNEVYQKLLSRVRVETEYACAKGGMVFKPYVSKDKLSIECVQADKIFPISFENGDLVSCIFVDEFTAENTLFTRLEFHRWENGSCTIINKAYKSEFSADLLGVEIPLTKVERWAGIEPEIHITGLSRPLFSYFKVPLANTVDSRNDLGVSVYSKAENLIRQADEQYSRILWEYEGSELAIDADATALKAFDGSSVLPKREERLFRKLDLQGGNGDFYSVFSPAIRDSSLFNGLNKILQRIEFACGLAYGTISDVQETAKTATEILSSKQRSYATVSDIQKALQRSLENLIVSMNDLCDLYGLVGPGEYETSFEFDDSLIVDSATDQAIMMQEVAAGIIRPEIYLMRRYGLSEEQCKEWLPKMDVEAEEGDVEEE